MMKIGRVLHPTDDRAERWKEPGSLTLVGGGGGLLIDAAWPVLHL